MKHPFWKILYLWEVIYQTANFVETASKCKKIISCPEFLTLLTFWRQQLCCVKGINLDQVLSETRWGSRLLNKCKTKNITNSNMKNGERGLHWNGIRPQWQTAFDYRSKSVHLTSARELRRFENSHGWVLGRTNGSNCFVYLPNVSTIKNATWNIHSKSNHQTHQPVLVCIRFHFPIRFPQPSTSIHNRSKRWSLGAAYSINLVQQDLPGC